jgi:hypothetical protein
MLKSFLLFPYLTPHQVCDLHLAKTSFKWAEKRLLRLIGSEKDDAIPKYLRRGKEKRHNKTWDPYLYTLSLQGMRHLEKLGQDRPHFYPTPREIILFQWEHFLLTNEVLISALKLPDVLPNTTIWDAKHDFALKHILKVAIPDDWVHFVINGEHVPIWFEVHIDTGEEKFKKKIAAILKSVKDEYKRVLKTEFVTVSFVTPKKDELEKIMAWTKEELVRLGAVKEADLFRFAIIPEKEIDPKTLFLSPIHATLYDSHGWTLI